MRLRFTPPETSFYDLFAEAADNIVQAAGLLGELIAAPAERRPEVAARIRDAEHAGDDIAHRTMRQLNSTFVTPFDREDIYTLTGRLDDVVDYIEATADLIVLYKIEEIPAELAAVVDVLARAAAVQAEALPRLRTLKNLEEYWIEANRLENEADQLHRRFVAQLFGGSYDALAVLKLKDVAEQLEEAADAFEHVANTVEAIAVKES